MAYFSTIEAFAAPTSGSTVDFRKSGMTTTPVAVEAFAVKATADLDLSDSNQVADMAHSIGASDFTNEWYCSWQAENAAAVSNCDSAGDSDALVRLFDPSGTDILKLSGATALSDSGSGAGIQLTVDTAGASGWIVVLVFWFNVTATAGVHTTNATIDSAKTESTNGDPTLVKATSVQATMDGTINAHVACVRGYSAVVADGSTDQFSQSKYSEDGVTVTNESIRNSETMALRHHGPTSAIPAPDYPGVDIQFVSGGFESRPKNQDVAHDFGYLALDFGGEEVLWTGLLASKTSTGTGQLFSEPNLLPDSVEIIVSGQRVSENVLSGASANSFGVGIFDADDEHTIVGNSENGRGTSDTASYWATSPLRIAFLTTGSSNYLLTNPDFVASGFALDVDITNTVDRVWTCLVVSRRVVGSASGSLPLLTADGSGRQIHTSAASGTLPVVTGSGSATQIFTGAALGSLPLLRSTGASAARAIGSVSGTLPRLASAVDALQRLFGSSQGTFPLLDSSGAGNASTTGVASGSLPMLDASGAARQLVVGSGAGSLTRLDGASLGTQRIIGASSGILPLLQASGADTQDLVCSVQLVASWSQETAFSAARQQQVELSASQSSESSLDAGRHIDMALVGSYNVEADLEGSCS